MNKKVAIYVRVSTPHQKTDLQENDLLTYSRQRNLHIYKIYKDVISGAKDSRPSLNNLMNDAYKRKFDIVLVWRFDRFARSTRHLCTALEEFQNLGIDFISYQENINTSSPIGRAMFTILSSIAQLERDIIRERILAGVAAAKAKGKILGRPKKRNDLKIRHLRQKGYSLRKISKELNVSLGSVQQALKGTVT